MTSPGSYVRVDAAAEAATARRCDTDPNFLGIYRMLEKVEGDAHRRQWNHPDNTGTLFQVIRAPRPRTDVALNAVAAAGVGASWLQGGFERFCRTRDGNVGAALLDVAVVCEYLRKEADKDDYHGDLEGAPLEGFETYGIGLLNEVWAVEQQAASGAEAEAIVRARGRRPTDHPNRQEMRMLWLAGRDGIMWHAVRRRGEQLRIAAELPDSDEPHQVGDIVHALSRITNALVSNPVPTWPRTHKTQHT